MSNAWDIDLTGPQTEFFASKAQYPCFVGGWGSGKTCVLALKAMDFSIRYPGNQGVIFRRNFTDLKDSTMADFERYTGLKVAVQAKSVVLPNGSKILFHHLDELAGIAQNINLGWFGIEQAEEFDNEQVFSVLRGRLRRIVTPLVPVQEKLCRTVSPVTGKPILDEVLSDWVVLSDPNDPATDLAGDPIRNPAITTEVVYYTKCDIAELGLLSIGESVRQGYLIANTNGHNWMWRLWKQGTLQDGHLTEGTAFDNPHLPGKFLEDLERMKDESPTHYRRYVLNSWEDTDTADRIISYQDILDAIGRDLREYGDSVNVLACDPAEFGDDKTVIYRLKGLTVTDKVTMEKKDPMQVAGRLVAMHREEPVDTIIVDDIGVGAGVRAALDETLDPNHEQNLVMGFKTSWAAMDKGKYIRMRDQVWGHAGQLFRDGYVSLLRDDDDLVEDLAAHTYSLNSKGQMLVARKKDIKKVLSRSPDSGDALVMGLWAAEKGTSRIETLVGADREDDYDAMRFGL